MTFEKSDFKDLPLFETFWKAAVEYQQRKNGLVWQEFPAELIRFEMENGNHYSGAENGEICGYFSLVWRDEIIWGEREKDDAVYLHRMCVNPAKKGSRFAEKSFVWAKNFARLNDKKYLRIDTWLENKNLIEYYLKVGFKLVGKREINFDPTLLPHYQNIKLALFENLVEDTHFPAAS